MKKNNIIRITLSIFCGISAVLIMGLMPLFQRNLPFGAIVCALCLSTFSGYIIKSEFRLNIKNFIFLLILNYIVLILGQQLFEFVIIRQLTFYEYKDVTIYENLLDIAINDLGRNFLIFTGIIYSFVCTTVCFTAIFCFRKTQTRGINVNKR